MVLAVLGGSAKTPLLRRLKGEPFRDEEPSTHGLDVWAGQAEAHLQADGSAAGPWAEWKEFMHHTAVKDVFACALHLVTQRIQSCSCPIWQATLSWFAESLATTISSRQPDHMIL